MSNLREGPRFNLKAVIQQTGLKPDTLRAWERRYGLPSPKRSSGGHRLYSQRDIETVRWLMSRQREGLSIKRAVELWQQIETEGRDPLQAATPLAVSGPPLPIDRQTGTTISELREEWVKACLAFEELLTEQLVSQAFALYPPETVALELLQKALSQIGDAWYRGEVTVQQEHFCSALIIRRLEALVMAAPPPSRPGRILVACPPNENHIVGPLLLTFLLKRRGWQVVYLGANVPVERLETTIASIRPHLVVMAAQQLHTAATLAQAAAALEKEGVALAYGGLIFNLAPELRKRISGHFLGERLENAPQMVESLITAPQPVPNLQAVPDAYRHAQQHFEARQPLLEAYVVQALQATDWAHNHLAMASRELNLNINAALTLGDINYLGTELDWVEGLLKNHRVPQEALHTFLQAYHQAAREQLDERGEPIILWLGKLLNSTAPGTPVSEVLR